MMRTPPDPQPQDFERRSPPGYLNPNPLSAANGGGAQCGPDT